MSEPLPSAMPKRRAVVFVALFAYITLAPGYVQLLGGRPFVARPWQMFTGRGLDATAVTYTQRRGTGPWKPLDRYAVLAPTGIAPESLRFVRGPKEAIAIGNRLKDHLDTDVEIHVHLETATKDGWRVALDRTIGAVPQPNANPEPETPAPSPPAPEDQ